MSIEVIVLAFFIVGYSAIILEDVVRLNKAASALICGVSCWILYFFNAGSATSANEALMHHFAEIASLLFFLLGAMTIVEVVDRHAGFAIMSEWISSPRLSRMIVIVSALTFVLSAVIDNLTTAIVMCTLCQKLIADQEDRRWFAAVIIISANAGGVWSPVGDVTTTMLWLGGQITASHIVMSTVLPSLVVATIPTVLIAHRFRGRLLTITSNDTPSHSRDSIVILCSALTLFLAVPISSAMLHMPPFLMMLLALGLLWVLTTVLHRRKDSELRVRFSVADALQNIDTPTILFFVGILLSVSALHSFGILEHMATALDASVGNVYIVAAFLGLLSALVDNIPLVAAAQGMYPLTRIVGDHPFWSMLALTTGTGGSIVLIGSAAGVAIMGMDNIPFMWYAKKISWIAALAFALGTLVFMLIHLI